MKIIPPVGADYAGEKDRLDNVIVTWQEEYHAMQSRGSGEIMQKRR